MIHQATFKGLILPKDEKHIQAKDNGATYEVQVFLDQTQRSSSWRARIVGGGRLDVKTSSPQTAMLQAEGFFRTRLGDWEELR